MFKQRVFSPKTTDFAWFHQRTISTPLWVSPFQNSFGPICTNGEMPLLSYATSRNTYLRHHCLIEYFLLDFFLNPGVRGFWEEVYA